MGQRSLPAEIWGHIVSHIDKPVDLTRLARTCKLIHLEARRALYRDLEIGGQSVILGHLPLSQPLADEVHTLRVYDSDFGRQPRLVHMEEQIRQLLPLLKNLKHLILPGGGLPGGFYSTSTVSNDNVSHPSSTFPFDLTEFGSHSQDPTDGSFMHFVKSQKTIQVLSWVHSRPLPTPFAFLEDDDLPDLHTLCTDQWQVAFDILSTTARRKVIRLWVTAQDPPGLPWYPHVEVLRANKSLSEMISSGIERALPGLRYLECWDWKTETPSIDSHSAERFFAQFQGLEKLRLGYGALLTPVNQLIEQAKELLRMDRLHGLEEVEISYPVNGTAQQGWNIATMWRGSGIKQGNVQVVLKVDDGSAVNDWKIWSSSRNK